MLGPVLQFRLSALRISDDDRLGSAAAESPQCNTCKHYVCSPLVSGRAVAFSGATVEGGGLQLEADGKLRDRHGP